MVARKRLDDTFVRFDYDDLEAYDDTCLKVVCLSDRDVSIILSCLRFVTWPSRWEADGKLLRDQDRTGDLMDAIARGERLIDRIGEC